jgi:hypothetical protein
MRRDGDLLLVHLAQARKNVLLCAPFIKRRVIERLFAAIRSGVAIEIVTRWRPEEVAAGVSDLDVFDVASSRPRTTLRLLDNLHAKLYLSDDNLLAGSANLTATALGWCTDPNLELLAEIPADSDAVMRCLAGLAAARLATSEERATIQAQVDAMPLWPGQQGESVVDAFSGVWLPRLAAPDRLFTAYVPATRDRLTSSTIEAADHDLSALAISPNLSEGAFRSQVADRLSTMPAVSRLLSEAKNDLSDSVAVQLIETLVEHADMSATARWQVVRDWLTYFLRETVEIAPQTFVTRLRPGANRNK